MTCNAIESPKFLVPNTPAASPQVSSRFHPQPATNHTVAETPFAKTLGYSGQHKGAENNPTKPRRKTAHPAGIATIAALVNDAEGIPDSGGLQEPPIHAEHVGQNHMQSTTGADRVLEDSDTVSPDISHDSLTRRRTRHAGYKPPLVHAYNLMDEQISLEDGEACSGSTSDNIETQLIVYSRHPTFVSVIGLLPETMFWAAAAQVAKYTNITVDLLIDKLGDIYL